MIISYTNPPRALISRRQISSQTNVFYHRKCQAAFVVWSPYVARRCCCVTKLDDPCCKARNDSCFRGGDHHLEPVAADELLVTSFQSSGGSCYLAVAWSCCLAVYPHAIPCFGLAEVWPPLMAKDQLMLETFR